MVCDWYERLAYYVVSATITPLGEGSEALLIGESTFNLSTTPIMNPHHFSAEFRNEKLSTIGK